MLSKDMSKNVKNVFPLISRVYLIYGTILMITIQKSVEEFCESYKANNYSIDYQYDHQFDKGVLHLLVIDHNYWQITFYSRFETLDFELRLEPEEGVSNWFGNKYMTGFSYWSTAYGKFISGLMTRGSTSNEYQIDWGFFLDTNKSGLKFANISVRNSTKLNLEYKSVVSTSEFSSVVFMNKSLSSSENKLIKYDLNDTIDEILEESSNHSKQKDHTKGIDLEVIARFKDGCNTKDLQLSSIESGFIAYLFKSEKLIKYCIISANSEEICSGNKLKTLIDCKYKPNILVKVIQIIVVLIVAAIMTLIGLYLLIYHRRRYTNPDADVTLDDSSDTDTASHSRVSVGFNEPIELSKNTIKISKFKSEEMVPKATPKASPRASPKATPKQKSKVSPQKTKDNKQKLK